MTTTLTRSPSAVALRTHSTLSRAPAEVGALGAARLVAFVVSAPSSRSSRAGDDPADFNIAGYRDRRRRPLHGR